MTSIRQQAQLSRLAFTNQADIQEEPSWRSAEWLPLPGGGRVNHGSVVVDHPDKNKGQLVAVMGGYTEDFWHQINSVYLLNVDERNKEWREASAMNEERHEFAAVVCHGAV